MLHYGSRWALLGLLSVPALAGCGSDSDPLVHENANGGSAAGGSAAGGKFGLGGVATNGGASGGVTSNIENPCGAPDKTLGALASSKLFVEEGVPTFDLYLPADSWANLQVHARDEQYVQAQACFNGKSVGLVGFRFKGSYGSLFDCFNAAGENTCRKLSMKIKFDEYVPDQLFYGIKRLNFQGYHYDASYLSERLAYDLYRDSGIVAPRATWAKLRVNGDDRGLFGMVEEIDGRFAADRWPDNPDQNIYKEIWPGQTDTTWITSHLQSNKTTADVSQLVAFSEALNAAPEEQLRATLGKYVDLNYMARYMAVDDAIANFDGVTTFYTSTTADQAGNHNYNFYEESPNKFTIIPWDLESTLSLGSQFGNVPYWQTTPSDCSVLYGVWNGQAQVSAPGCNRVFRAISADLTEYRAAAQAVLDGPFAVDKMVAKIDSLASYIRADASVDPHGPGADEFEKYVGFLKQAIPSLRRRLEHRMSGEPTNPLLFSTIAVNDFESSDSYGLYASASMLSNPNSTTAVEVNTATPISGTKTLRITFNFGNETTAWQQWMYYAVPMTKSPTDVTALTGIRMKLRSNVARTLRFNLDSPNNSSAVLGIKKGWDVPVTAGVTTATVLFADANVQSWAKDPGDNLAKVLSAVAGLAFEPQCVNRNGVGQLPAGVTDQGWVDIDDLEFY